MSANFPNVVDLSYGAFVSCINLIDVDMPYLRTLNGDVFYHCSNLRNISFPSLEVVSYRTF